MGEESSYYKARAKLVVAKCYLAKCGIIGVKEAERDENLQKAECLVR